MRCTVAQAAEALGIRPPQGSQGIDPLAGLAGASIDSRTVQPGELFFAIRGPRHDGHDFVAASLDRGAVAAVVARDRFAGYGRDVQAKLLVVDDTLAALHRLASWWREKWRGGAKGRLIGAVAGSVGKTTTKEILAALVGARFRVLKTQGNLNNEYGLPLTLLKLGDEHDAAVVELGMSHHGELAQLTKIAAPDVGVVTRVAVEHLEFFSSIDDIARAERELIENLDRPGAVAVLNADDERVAKFAEVARGRVVTFGLDAAKADFRGDTIEERGIEGAAFDCISPAGCARLESPLIGRHNVMNALGALAAASVWGIGAEDARRVFPSLKAADKRGEVVRYEIGFTVINDSYNSSPTALRELTNLLASTPGYSRRILAAGEMLELGPSSPELHAECGRFAGEKRTIDWIFGVQGGASEFVRAAIEAGRASERAKFFENSAEAAQFLAGFVERGDLLLIKGSRGVRMERILEALDAKFKRVAPKTTSKMASETVEVSGVNAERRR